MTLPTASAPFLVYNASAGSGKTYTLVKNYLKILLKTNNPFQFQQILAMTFTNKAAAEMKTRVLETLDAFQQGNAHDSMFQDIKKELQLTDEVIQKRARTIFKTILNHYAAFNISTIDSFTYKLIKSFAFDLGLSMNFEVEMAPKNLIRESIDVLLSKIGHDPELSKTLIQFAKEKANEDKDWNIEKELQEIAKLILKEEDIAHLKTLKDKKITDFTALDAILFKRIKDAETQLKSYANEVFRIIASTNLKKEDFVRGGFYSFFTHIKNLALDKINLSGTLEKNIQKDHHQCSGKASPEAKAVMQEIKPQLTALYQKVKQWFEMYYAEYNLDVLVKKSLIPLSVLKSIQQLLEEIKMDNNILFNAEFNQIIHQHLAEQPAAFIYEKIGEKYRHYFIDEMQDTSVLQWHNSIPLIKNALESENEKNERGSLLLVGDAKQSIYRWRGSKPEQFIGLTLEDNPFFVDKKVATLKTNYRSHENIISFNNHFFQFISNYLQNETYKQLYIHGNKQLPNTKKGGYVEITLFEGLKNKEEKNEAYPQKVLEIIQKLEGKFNKNEICILAKKREQGVAIANYLSDNGVEIVSSETLLLDNSPKVRFIIDLLQFIAQPEDQKAKFNVLYFLHKHLGLTQNIHPFLDAYISLDIASFFNKLKEIDIHFQFQDFMNIPFYESIESIIRSFKLTQKSDAYLQFFLDIVLEFSQKQNSGLTEFITQYQDKKDTLSIVVPEGKDAVTVMTIHKSKGLEFPVVIYAYDLDIYYTLNTEKTWYDSLNPNKFNGFTKSLVSYNKNKLEATGEIGKAIVKEKTEALELDNFNLFYVALTRAKEQLYVLSEYKPPKSKKSTYPSKYGEFLFEFLQHNTNFTQKDNQYHFGDINRVSSKAKPIVINQNQELFLSSPWQEHQITIVVNTSIANDFDDARKYGTLLHEILAEINYKEEVENTIQKFVNKGIIPIDKKETIQKIIQSVVMHSDLTAYYTNNFTIYNEREILTEENEILIPDRIAIQDNQATIIDYKTGNKEAKHQKQIQNYVSILEKMGYTVVKKILVYLQTDKIELILA